MGHPTSAMPRPMPASLAQRRLAATPLALLLVGWGLALGPLWHAVVGHGLPVLTSAEDSGWVHHGPKRSGVPPRPQGHAHAVDAPDHFQVPIHLAAPPAVAPLLVVRAESSQESVEPAPTLDRRWVPALPQGP
jgi:hypothetical protein